MKASTDLPTIEALRALYAYAPDTGSITWKVRRAPNRKPGDPAGFQRSKDYLGINCGGRSVYYHRAAWALHYGEWPAHDLQVDHINGNKHDNRIANLRVLTKTENQQNIRQAFKNKPSALPLGVFPHTRGGKFFARIQVDKKPIHLGTYETPEEAGAAYLKAKRKYHPTTTI